MSPKSIAIEIQYQDICDRVRGLGGADYRRVEVLLGSLGGVFCEVGDWRLDAQGLSVKTKKAEAPTQEVSASRQANDWRRRDGV